MTGNIHLLEGALNLYSDEPTMMTPALLQEAKERKKTSDIFDHTNIYVIVSRGRMCAIPGSLRVDAQRQWVLGRLVVYGDKGHEEYLDFRFRVEDPVPIVGAEVEHQYDNNIKLLYANGKDVILPIYTVAPYFDLSATQLPSLHVEYIGKAWGKDGERTAIERTQSHESLNKILASTNQSNPLREVYLLLYRFNKHRRILGTSPFGPEPNDDKEYEHWMKIRSTEFTREERILLAEAALINYFKPEFNDKFKHRFPHKDQEVLSKLLDVDFGGLVAEISTKSLGAKLVSNTISDVAMPNFLPFHHNAVFELHLKKNRRTFLSYAINPSNTT